MSNFIEFISVECKNLASVGNMPIKIQLNKHNTTMVVGSNGVGKSSLLLDSICFALFGKPYRNVTKGQLVNSRNNRELLTTVELKRGNDNIKVIRGYKPAVFEIWLNGKMLDQSASVRDYQEIFENEILGIDYTTFTQIVMIGRANYIPFLSLKASDKREFVENVLGLQIFSSMSDIHKENVKTYKSELSYYETKRSELLHIIDKNKSLIEQVKRHNESILAYTPTDNSEKIKQLEENIVQLQAKIADLSGQLKDVDVSNVGKIQDAIKDITSKIAVSKHTCSKHKKDLDFYEGNETCPTCTQQIDEQFRQDIIKRTKSELGVEISNIDNLSSLCDKLQSQLNKIKEIVHSNENVKSSMTQHSKDIEILRAKISTLSIKNNDIPPLQNDGEYVTILENTNAELKELEKHYDAHLEKGKYFDVISSLLKDNGLKSKIISEYIPVINKLINQNIKQLGLFATVKIDDTFDEKISMRGFDDMTYNQLSEGEKLRLNMAVMMAWRDVARYKSNMSSNLLIMDEIFDSSVDVEGTQAFAELLKAVSDLNVFVITHTPEKLSDTFRSLIRLEKVDGFTVISNNSNF